jgi:membrane fusion protein, multidrug efflux system
MSKDTAKPDWAMNKRERANAERVAQGLKPKRGRGWMWFVGFVVVAAGAGGWFVQSGKYAEMQAARAEAAAEAEADAAARAARAAIIHLASFEVTTITPATLSETLKVTGSLSPVRQVALSAEVSGRVVEVNVRAGDAVKAGDVLVRFDTETLDSQIAQAKANAEATRVQLDQAQSDFDRTNDLVSKGLAASNSLDRARTTLDQLTASLRAQETLVANAQTARDRAVVTAPFAGVISDRAVEPGQFAGTGSPLITLVDMTSLEMDATAPVSFAPELGVGLSVDISVEGFGDRQFTGTIARLNPVANAGSRMLPVYVTLSNEDGALRGGMFATGRIVLEARPDGIAVPPGAIRRDADATYVLVIEDDHVTRHEIETVRSWDGGALEEVTGLEPGDMVVTEPLPELKAGDQIKLDGMSDEAAQ